MNPYVKKGKSFGNKSLKTGAYTVLGSLLLIYLVLVRNNPKEIYFVIVFFVLTMISSIIGIIQALRSLISKEPDERKIKKNAVIGIGISMIPVLLFIIYFITH